LPARVASDRVSAGEAKMGRLTRIHIGAIALILLAGIAAAFMMVLVKPRRDNISQLSKRIADEQAKAAERPRVQAALARAEREGAAAKGRWEGIMDTKMSCISLKDVHVAMFEINKESDTYAGQVSRALNSNPDIRFVGQLSFPGIGWTPPSQTMERREFPQSSLQIQARAFPALLDWLRNTESLPRVMQLGGNISLSGPSPWIAASIPATFYIYYRDAKATAPAEEAAAPATGMPGMMGMPGMPGMMPGMMGPGMMGPGMGGPPRAAAPGQARPRGAAARAAPAAPSEEKGEETLGMGLGRKRALAVKEE